MPTTNTKVKFFKGKSIGDVAISGTDAQQNTISTNNGAIVFGSDKKIYTVEDYSDGKVNYVEYYKDYLNFGDNQIATKGVLAGKNLSNKSLKEILELMFFATYYPKWTDPAATAVTSDIPSASYVMKGSTYNIEATLTVTQTSKASAISYKTGSTSGTKYAAYGGNLSSATINGNPVSSTASGDTITITASKQLEGTYTNNIGSTQTVGDFFTLANVTFAEGNTAVVKSDGTTNTNKTSSSANSESGTVNSDIDSTTYKIKSITLSTTPTISTNSVTNWVYLPIYCTKEITEIRTEYLSDYNSGTPTLTITPLTSEAVQTTLNIDNANEYKVLTAEQSYNVEADKEHQFIIFGKPSTSNKSIQFALPDGLTIDTSIYFTQGFTAGLANTPQKYDANYTITIDDTPISKHGYNYYIHTINGFPPGGMAVAIKLKTKTS